MRLKIQTIEEAVRTAFAEAREATNKGSYGVSGAIIDLRDGSVVHTMQNKVITGGRLVDPTAHGERQLLDLYYAQKNCAMLPRLEDAIIVTSLDPCCMCTGSILAGGFSAAISALNDTAGINFDGLNRFLPFDEPLKTFFYPEVTDSATVVRRGYVELPEIFTRRNLSKSIVEDCGAVFIDGARKAWDVVNRMSIPKDLLKDPSTTSDEIVQFT